MTKRANDKKKISGGQRQTRWQKGKEKGSTLGAGDLEQPKDLEKETPKVLREAKAREHRKAQKRGKEVASIAANQDILQKTAQTNSRIKEYAMHVVAGDTH